MPTLVILSGPLEGQRIEIEAEVTVGREGAELELEDAEVSRRHAKLRPVAGGLEVEDLGSRNGTRVNGQRITTPVTVADGATLKLGQTTARVELAVPETRGQETVIGSPQVTAESPTPERSDRTVVGTPVRDGTPTSAGDRPARAPRPAPRRQAEPVGFAPATEAPAFGTLKASAGPRRRGVASRLWVPMAATYLAILGTAAGLIAYFIERS